MSANQSWSNVTVGSDNHTMTGRAPGHLLSGNQVLFLFTKTSVTIKFTIMMLMFLIGTPGNGFMAYVIWKTPQLRSRTNILLAWLTICDMLAGFTTTFFVAVYQFIIFVLSNDPCHFITLIGVSFTFLKIPNFAGYAIMICIAIDRFVAVVYPFHYATLITERWAKVSLVISWCFGFFVGFVYAIYLTRVDFTSCAPPYSFVIQSLFDNGTYVIGVIFLILIYGKIFKTAIEQANKIGVTSALSAAAAGVPPTRTPTSELKAVRTTALILGSYVVLWFPMMVGRFLQGIGDTEAYTQTIIDVGLSIGCANMSFNWIIYGTSSSEFRRAIKKILKFKNSEQ